MRDEYNRKLYAPINVLRTFGATYEDFNQDYYVFREPIRGASTLQMQLWGIKRPPRKFDEKTLVVPGSTQTNSVSISVDAGGHFTKWVYQDNSGSSDLLNTFSSFGRCIATSLVIFNDLTPMAIESIASTGTTTTITLKERHPFEMGRTLGIGAQLTVAAASQGTVTINGTYSTFFSSNVGSDYRRKLIIPVDISGSTSGTYSGGTVSIRLIHNPTQGGSIIATGPDANTTEGDTRTADGIFCQGSPVIDWQMTSLGANQGYIESTCLPMEYNPDSYGGGQYIPVLWHGARMKHQLWINFEGNEGVHKMVTTIITDNPIFVGDTFGLSVNLDCYLKWGLGETTGEPIPRATTFDAFFALKQFKAGAESNLFNINWAGGGGGHYCHLTDFSNIDMRLDAAYRSNSGGTTSVSTAPNHTAGTGDPFKSQSGLGNGGAVTISNPLDTTTFGLWGVAPANPTLNGWVITNFGGGDNKYNALGFGFTAVSQNHHFYAGSDGVLAAGERKTTNWIITGNSSTLFTPGLEFFNKMINKGYF